MTPTLIQTIDSVKHVGIFANPIAGQGRSKAFAHRLALHLRSEGIDATDFTDGDHDASAELAHADVVVAIGGDGTLRAVARRCLDQLGKIPPLLPIPMGTANLMGRHLGINWHAADREHRVAESIRQGRLSYLDLAQANGELFLLMAGVGIDGAIIHEISRIRKGPISYASYVIPTALALAKFQFTPLRVTVDGREIFPLQPAVAFVANVAEYGVGFPLAPDSLPNDGLLDVCVIPVATHDEMLSKFLYAAAGEHMQTEGAVHVRGKQIDIESSAPVPVQVDGDPGGSTPLHIDLLPIKVPFIVPV